MSVEERKFIQLFNQLGLYTLSVSITLYNPLPTALRLLYLQTPLHLTLIFGSVVRKLLLVPSMGQCITMHDSV